MALRSPAASPCACGCLPRSGTARLLPSMSARGARHQRSSLQLICSASLYPSASAAANSCVGLNRLPEALAHSRQTASTSGQHHIYGCLATCIQDAAECLPTAPGAQAGAHGAVSGVTEYPAQLLAQVADLADSGPAWGPLLVGTGLLLGGAAAVKLALYTRMQTIIVAMLSKYVRKGGARVLQLGGGSRDLYYYPSDTVLVTLVGQGINEGLMQQASVQAGVPVQIQDRAFTDLSFQRTSSVDSVVALFALHRARDLPRFMDEVARVLKPNGSFVFVEHVRGRDGTEKLAQQLLGHGDSCLDQKDIETITTTAQLETLQIDVALPNIDPHAVGVAVKAAQQVIDMHEDDVRVTDSQARKGAKRKKSKAR